MPFTATFICYAYRSEKVFQSLFIIISILNFDTSVSVTITTTPRYKNQGGQMPRLKTRLQCLITRRAFTEPEWVLELLKSKEIVVFCQGGVLLMLFLEVELGVSGGG